MVALCGAEPRADSLVIDRKFHEGMIGFTERLDYPLCCLIPQYTLAETRNAMDMVEVPLSDLPYGVKFLSSPPLSREGVQIIEQALNRVALVCLGAFESVNFAIADLCRTLQIPYVLVSEYTLRTELEIMKATTPGISRRIWREAKIRTGRPRRMRMAARAVEVHANGYPTYVELESANPRHCLYFDTRARAEDVISEKELGARLDLRKQRRPSIVYTGRYHPMKGTLDVVKAGLELHRSGFDFKLDLYGTGPLKEQMVSLVRDNNALEKISVNEAMPYRPDLQRIAKQSDLFLCCHVQGDPSCTYLESFACGLPIIGYANEMWEPLCLESKAGHAIKMGEYDAMAVAAAQLLRDTERLKELSHRARVFAAANTMEIAWDRRASRLNAILQKIAATRGRLAG
jgi:colanic acid/amylovoran biosynthesis glycosyltransferase